MSITFSPITRPDDPRFGDFLRIYEEALPERERKTSDEIRAQITRDDYKLVLAVRDGRVVGFIALYVSLSQPIALLEYMATDKTCRNMGLGALMFRESLSRAAGRPVLVEVDSPREQAPDMDLRKRRQSFYLREGCAVAEGLDYILPLKGRDAPPVMDLMVHRNGQPEVVLSPSLLRAWLQDIYVGVYEQSADDERIQAMLVSWEGGQ